MLILFYYKAHGFVMAVKLIWTNLSSWYKRATLTLSPYICKEGGEIGSPICTFVFCFF